MEHKVTITRIIDGDTIEGTVHAEVLDIPIDIRTRKFRLVAIDAPERFTESGKAATEKMKELVLGRTVDMFFTGRRSFERYVTEAMLDGENLSVLMVESGHAVYYDYRR